jgi:predicted membrane protein
MSTSKLIRRLAIAYLGMSLAIPLYQNIFGDLTAFAWTGSITGNLVLFF